MYNDWHKVMNNEVHSKLKRGVAPSGFKLPKARKDHAIHDVRVLEEIHKRYIYIYYGGIQQVYRYRGKIEHVGISDFTQGRVWILAKNYRAVVPKR